MSAATAIRVLAVEDDRAVRSFLARAIETGGYEPVLAQTGAEAIAALHGDDAIAVALIDGFLPDMHGMRLARTILDDEPAEPAQPVGLCFVTGGITESSPQTAGVGLLAKPMRLKELLQMVAELLAWRDAGGSPPSERRAALARFEHAFLVGP